MPIHLLLIQLLSLTFVSLPLSLVTVSLISYQATCDGTNRSTYERPLGRLVFVVVPDHPADDRAG
jgi:hypothetical protein